MNIRSGDKILEIQYNRVTHLTEAVTLSQGFEWIRAWLQTLKRNMIKQLFYGNRDTYQLLDLLQVVQCNPQIQAE